MTQLLYIYRMYMFVYLFLPFASRLVPASAYEIPLRRVEREISNRHSFGTLPSNSYLGYSYSGSIPTWNSLGKQSEALSLGKGSDFIKTRKPTTATNLEISKSIELKFDPKNKILMPVFDETDKKEKAYKSSITLLTPFTQKQLAKLFEIYDKEAKGGGITDVKNYQTGRFKLHHLKRPRFRV